MNDSQMLSHIKVNMLEQLLKLIQEYQTRVREAASLFQEYKGMKPSSLRCWRQAGLSKEGFIDPEQRVEYFFHGIGCCVKLPNGKVDWDFGHDGRLDGFDAWRLWCFADDGTDDFPEFKRKEILDAAFREAIAQGIIHAPFRNLQDDLYYLQSEVIQ